jgi:small neutral amino acid transporter SnatA (MarC family)
MTSTLAVLTLVVGVPLNLLVTVMLWGKSFGAPHIKVLRERAIVAVLVLLTVLVFGLIFRNNDTVPPWIGLDTTKIITRVMVLLLAIVPALYCLWLYRNGHDDAP